MKIYLSHSLLFSPSQREIILPRFVAALEKLGLEVIEPWAKNHTIEANKEGWSYLVGQSDKADVANCDAIFAIVNGVPDEGVSVEIGMAIALKKKVFLFRDDVRKMSDAEGYPLNLMYFSGYNKDDWKEYFFTNIDEISSPDKALYKWVNEVKNPQKANSPAKYGKSICVYCGASVGSNPIYLETARQLGEMLAKQGFVIIYGGSSLGTMGALATSALKEGGKVIGVIAKIILDKEKPQDNLTELHIVDSMQERKDMMIELADGFIVLPGGGGTLEEFADVFSRGRLGQHNKPIGILNIEFYYRDLSSFINRMVADEFLSSKSLANLKISEKISGLLDFFQNKIPSLKEDTSSYSSIFQKAVGNSSMVERGSAVSLPHDDKNSDVSSSLQLGN